VVKKDVSFVFGALLLTAGVVVVAMAPRNTSLEGWAMLARALVGQALIVYAVDVFARASPRRARVRVIALLATSLLLLPLSALALAMSKESGSSWGIAALVLLVWYFGSAVYTAIKLMTARPRS
jgi:hypothetical protein